MEASNQPTVWWIAAGCLKSPTMVSQRFDRNEVKLTNTVTLIGKVRQHVIYFLELNELCHNILSHFCEVESHLQTEESLKVIVYYGRKTQKR